MNTQLPKKSQSHQKIIDEIKDIILEKGKNKIAYIILFGSFAKGNWVNDAREEKDGSLTTYQSDYDFLVITKHYNQANKEAVRNFEGKVKEKVEKTILTKRDGHYLSLITEPLTRVNKELKRGQYFFSDIKKEGILLYQAEGVKELAEPKQLTQEEKKKMAEEDFETWFKKAEINIKVAKFTMEQQFLNKSAFELHQATETLFNCIELVFTSYRPKLHDLENLNIRCIPYSKELTNIFPKTTQEERTNFDLLRRAYVEARYDKDYSITKEQLTYLVGRVEKLKEVTEKICKKKLNHFKK